MKTPLLISFFASLAAYAQGQVCTHSDLSKTLLFKTEVKCLKQADSTLDSCIIRLTISSKVTRKPVQTISFTSSFLFGGAFRQCQTVRSFTTGKNQDAPAMDNDYGDLIVADFNFDGQEDFAVKNDSGGNGGPHYSYYLQTSSGRFLPDNFLTMTMSYFPAVISKSKKSLTTQVHADVSHYREATYQLSGSNWKLLRSKLLPTR